MSCDLCFEIPKHSQFPSTSSCSLCLHPGLRWASSHRRRLAMKSLRLFLGIVMLAANAAATQADDPLRSIGSMGSGNKVGNVLGDLGKVETPATPGPFSQGLGQIVR